MKKDHSSRLKYRQLLVISMLLNWNQSCSIKQLWSRQTNIRNTDPTQTDLGPAESTNQDLQLEKFEDLEDLDIDEDSKAAQIELKQARIWARIDQIEGQLLKQRQLLAVIEKGLRLGIPPDIHKKNEQTQVKANDTPLKDRLHSSHSRAVPNANRREKEKRIQQGENDPQSNHHMSTTTAAEEKNADLEILKDSYEQGLKMAREKFSEGKFGQAYIDFARLDREFDLSTSLGEPKYWLGRTWYKLKEYQQAKQYFNQFIRESSSNPWVPSAKYYKAKAEFDMGLQDLATAHLEEVIAEHPNAGSSEAARQMLNNIRQTL